MNRLMNAVDSWDRFRFFQALGRFESWSRRKKGLGENPLPGKRGDAQDWLEPGE